MAFSLSKDQCNSYLNKIISMHFSKMKSSCPKFSDASLLKYSNYFYSSLAKSRFKQAMINQFDKVESSGDYIEDAASPFVVFSSIEIPASHNYHLTDYYGALRVGAAIWIIEQIAKAGKFKDIFSLVPKVKTNKVLPYGGHYFAVKHLSFSPLVIESVSLAITNRYLSDYEKINSISFFPCVKTVDQLNGKTLHPKFKALLDLIPKESIEKSCSFFKSKVWELSSLIFQCQCEYYSKVKNLSLLNLDSESSNEWIHQNNVSFDYLDTIAENIFQSLGSSSSDKLDDLWLSADLTEKVSKFDFGNPFALCFALFYLSDIDDDIVWFLGTTGQLMLGVYQQLPWFDPKYFLKNPFVRIYGINVPLQESRSLPKSSLSPLYDYYHYKVNDVNFAQVLYRSSGVVIPYLFPFNSDVDNFLKDASSDIKFTMATVSGILNYPKYVLTRNVVDKDITDNVTQLKETLLKANEKANKLRDVLSNKTSDINKSKKIIKELRESNSLLTRKVNKLQSDYNTLKSLFEREHAELLDFRNIDFEKFSLLDVSSDDLEIDTLPKFPYRLHKKMAIFGGKESFKSILKQRFPDAHFYDGTVIRSEYIKNVDIVWINTFFINHSKLERICDYASGFHISIRYFETPGINCCSKQIYYADKS